MKRVIIIYGLISGALVAGMMWATMPLLSNGTIDFSNGMFYGYTSMVIALSLVFFGIKSYRDHHLNGSITFGKGFKVGILITLIASVMYCISWEICYDTVFTNFGDKYASYVLEQMKNSGATDAEIKAESENITKTFEGYKNPFIRFGYTMMEIFPVGLIVTLISAGLLRKKEVLPV